MNKATRLSVLSYLNWKQRKAQRLRFLNCFLLFLVSLLCVLGSPVLAQVPRLNNSYNLIVKNTKSPTTASSIVSPLQQGKILYDSGRFAEAVELLKQSVQEYRIQGDSLKLAVALSNLCLAYQQIGAWNEANQAITESLNLLQGQTQSSYLQVFAQSLDILGRLQLSQGKSEAALTTWQQAEKIYQNLSNKTGVLRSQINQAHAWQVQGFFRRATTILKEVERKLQSQPDSLEKAVGLRSLGESLLLVGDLTNSELALTQSLNIAERLQLSGEIAASKFSLGNHTRSQISTQENIDKAIEFYKDAARISPSLLTKTQAHLNYLSLLLEHTQQWAEVQNLIPIIQTEIEQLPPSRSTIYAKINFAKSLMKLLDHNFSKANLEINTQTTITLLAKALQQAIDLGDQRAQAYVLNSLGYLYEAAGQWKEAQTLAQKGLNLAQSSNAPDIEYLLQWQIGRLLWRQNKTSEAIAAYDSAVQTLQSLRSDLVAVNPDVQFSFRDSVQPIYRESVELLLHSQNSSPDVKTLEKARERIEALQLAELDNFFREACLQAQKVALDEVVDKDNPTAAIIYPIILPKELQVIVKIPNQPLKNYISNISQTDVERTITKLRKDLVNPAATTSVKKNSQQVYEWLVKQFDKDLQANGVKTLVFVLDGPLRNIPMAALFDGEQFLIEKYAVSLSVGLQLLDPQPLARDGLRALTAGLTQPPPDFPKYSPLPAIKSEFDLINKAGVSTISLLDQEFTREALKNKINSYPFNIVHLATHGEFSSRAENTFILAADTAIKVKDFNVILTGENQTKVELLVLSACQTATGDDRAALGLAGAAVRAGARSTLASLWQIDDESTALFVGEFYHELKNNNISKAEALRRAQIKLLNHPNYRTPGFWAAYVLIGNWL